MNNRLKLIFANKLARQSFLLLISTFLNMLFSVGVNFYLTRILDPIQYGNYSFIINIFIFSQTLFNFGYFYSVCRIISLTKEDDEIRSYYFAGILIWSFLSILMCVSLGGYAMLVDDFRHKHILSVFLMVLPLGTVYLFTQFNELVLQGDNRIELLSVSRIMPRVLFFMCLMGVFYARLKIDLTVILVTYLSMYVVVYTYIVAKLKPLRRNVQRAFRNIHRINRLYGFPIYVGSIFAVGVGNIVGIVLGLLNADNTEVGFYNIAMQISIPLSMIPNVIATVSYKKFMTTKIDKRIVSVLIGISLGVMLGILLFAKPFIEIVFGGAYLTAIPLLKYMCIGSLLYGIADFFNKYLLSNGYGKQLRTISFVVGGTILLVMYPFILWWGCYGAVYIKVVAGAVYLITISFVYHKTLRSHNAN